MSLPAGIHTWISAFAEMTNPVAIGERITAMRKYRHLPDYRQVPGHEDIPLNTTRKARA